jgi:hypothetical protein
MHATVQQASHRSRDMVRCFTAGTTYPLAKSIANQNAVACEKPSLILPKCFLLAARAALVAAVVNPNVSGTAEKPERAARSRWQR